MSKSELSASADAERKQLFKGIINPKKRVFLAAFARSGQVMKSCEAAGIHWTTHYYWKNHDKKYLAAFQMAEQVAADFMEDEVHRRGFDGIDHPVTYEGKITDTYKEYSDNLAMFRLKKLRPEYRDSFNLASVTGPISISIIHHPASLPAKRVIELEDAEHSEPQKGELGGIWSKPPAIKNKRD